MSKNNNIYSILSDLGLNDSSDDDDLENWINTKKKVNKREYKRERHSSGYTELNTYMNKRRVKNVKDKHKHMLCKSIISKKQCHYGQKCLYAHSLEEQKLNKVRDRAFKLIRGDIDASKVNIFQERDLYKTLLSLCELCTKCNEGKCTGGYNCREGAFDKKYVVCSLDLNKGKCTDSDCYKVHLTERGLKPYFDYILESQNMKLSLAKSNQGTLLTSEFFKKIKESKKKQDDIDGLDEDYLSDSSYDTDGSDGFYMDYDINKSIFSITI